MVLVATYLDSVTMTTPPSSRRSRVLVALAVAAVVVQLAVLYWPVVTIEGPVSWTDKVVHLLVFAVPTYAVGRALGSVRTAVLAFALHAPVSELIQHFLLPGRSGDVWDAVVDLVGVGLAAVVLVVGTRLRRWEPGGHPTPRSPRITTDEMAPGMPGGQARPTGRHPHRKTAQTRGPAPTRSGSEHRTAQMPGTGTHGAQTLLRLRLVCMVVL